VKTEDDMENMLALDKINPNELSPEIMEKFIGKLVQIDDMKKEYRHKRKEASFNLENKIDLWLSGKAEDTVRMYRLYVNEFVEWLNEKNVSVLNVNSKVVDEYVKKILNKMSYGKAHMIKAALSSFYSDLERWEDIDRRNPFIGAKIKKEIKIEEKIVPNEDEMKIIRDSFDGVNEIDRKMRFAIRLMSEYGVRVGFFDNMEYFATGKLVSRSKGKKYEVNIENIDIELLHNIKKNTIVGTFNRKMKELYNDGKIRKQFSPHDLRHYFACREYMSNNSLERLRRLLHHSNIAVTGTYLKGLGMEVID
jgi:site-specific recombinase XerD